MRLELGEAIQQINLGSEYFGEEITLVGGHVLHLPGNQERVLNATWRTSVFCEDSVAREKGGGLRPMALNCF
jgi:hypothetical protein